MKRIHVLGVIGALAIGSVVASAAMAQTDGTPTAGGTVAPKGDPPVSGAIKADPEYKGNSDAVGGIQGGEKGPLLKGGGKPTPP
jgi:hypothetical protein